MKYKTVKILPVSDFKNFKYTVTSDLLEREFTETVPNALGFYHYPETMTDEEGFNALKKEMIAAHKREIDNLTESIKKLEQLSFKEL